MLNRINETFSTRGQNITAQYLQTFADVGYVVVEAEGPRADAPFILDKLRQIPGTIRARILYEHAR